MIMIVMVVVAIIVFDYSVTLVNIVRQWSMKSRAILNKKSI